MPEMDGLELCRELRKTSQTPLLFLSSRTDEIDRILGLELGGDDYVTKPFSPRELVARVKAILKRLQPHTPPTPPRKILQYGKLKIDSHIRYIRAKFIDNRCPQIIQTVHRMGYKLSSCH